MKLIRAILVPFALLCVGLMRLLARYGIVIRIGEFWSPRLGHLAGNVECYLCERDEGMQKGFDIWTHHGPVANRYLAKMWRRCLWVDPTRFTLLVSVVNRLFQGWEKFTCGSAQFDRDIYNLFNRYPAHLRFTEAEERRGEKTLREWGIPKGAKWVCLINRDSAYLPHLTYHNYRDSDIKDYMLASLELATRGFHVFRMGAAVKSQLLIKHTMIHDYATNGMRSEFMDIYLGAKCEFCVSNGTGFDAIPYVFRRPICYVNLTQTEYMMTFVRDSLAIFKHHLKDGKRMTFQEIWDSGCGQFMAERDFAAQSISFENNSAQEIVQAVAEMCEYLKLLTPDRPAQKAFWNAFPRSVSPYNGKPLHGEIMMRIGSEFLKQYDT